MAKKKKSTKTSNSGRGTKSSTPRKKTGKQRTRGAEVQGIVFIAVSLFLTVSLYFNITGTVGHWVKNIILGLFGGPAYIFFVFVLWQIIKMFFKKDKDRPVYKIWLTGILMLAASVFWAAVCGGSEWKHDTFFENVESLYTFGIDGGGGGVIGGLLCVGFTRLIGEAGTYILSVAVMLILLVILTGVSVGNVIKRIGLYIKKNRDSISEKLDEEVEELPVIPQRDRKKPKAAEEKPAHTVRDTSGITKAADDGYFDVYFKGGEIETLVKRDSKPPIKRFVFEEDMPDETSEVAREVIAEQEKLEVNTTEKRKPFRVEDVKTGVLTELPDENGNFKATDDDDFTPPTQAQLEDRVDPLTQAALDAGVPIDNAVTVGKRMSLQEVQQAANSVNALAKESIEATRLINYKLPSVSLLAKPKPNTKSRAEIKHELEEKANRLLETLASFKVDAKIINITQGPTVTRFELQPGFGVKVSKITNLADDIALSLAASGVRIEAPIPGKSAIGIEIPNEAPSPVPIREVIDTDKFRDFKSKTAFALGKDIGGNCVIADISSFPHVLIAGATGSGKSVCINSLITSILYKAKPNEVKMIMVDPKMVELGVYNGIPHLLIPVVTDPKHAAGALNWAVAEMKNRYQLMKDNKVRNIQGYNDLMEENETPENKLPEIVIIIDELADLMLAAKNEVEDAINSLAALARAAGMYLVIATQRPSVDVITGVIKANVPSRISFAVSSQIDSRTILDSMGAEKLLGKGDMLYAPRGATKPIRIQGNFLSDEEIEDVIAFVKKQYEAEYDESILEHIEREQESRTDDADDDDDHTRSGDKDALFVKAAELVFESGQASVAMLQRRYKIGYQRAARIIDQLEENRIIGPYEGTKPRQVLITRAELNEMLMNNPD